MNAAGLVRSAAPARRSELLPPPRRGHRSRRGSGELLPRSAAASRILVGRIGRPGSAKVARRARRCRAGAQRLAEAHLGAGQPVSEGGDDHAQFQLLERRAPCKVSACPARRSAPGGFGSAGALSSSCSGGRISQRPGTLGQRPRYLPSADLHALGERLDRAEQLTAAGRTARWAASGTAARKVSTFAAGCPPGQRPPPRSVSSRKQRFCSVSAVF